MGDQPGPPAGYTLGIDLGTTYSAAAIVRGSIVEPCVLGTIAAQIPTVVVLRDNAEVLTGEAAERRAASEPARTAREFKRRLGDPIPIVIGGTPYGAEALMALMLQAIVGQVTQREGMAPATIVLTHPANYSDYKRGLLLEAARLAGLDLDRVRLITEPEAAAIAYARQQRIEPGEIIAVYDFGGGTFDAALVRDTAHGFELLGTPEGMERLGGIDFDQAVLAHVDAVLDGLVSAADAADPQVLAGQARLRDECRKAKEALSSDTDATIPVSIPGVQTEVRLTRDELEQMVRPRIAETVKALERTIASAGIGTDQVSRVLLVGGSSRMPIVAQVIRETIGRPVSIDADPKLAIPIGAALSGSPVPSPAPPVAVATRPETGREVQTPPRQARSQRSGRRVVVGALVAAGVAGAVVFALGRGGSGSTKTQPTAAPPVTSPLPTTPGSASSVQATAPVGSIAVAAAGNAITRLAFDGSNAGSGIPGPALAAGARTALTALAISPSGDVYVTCADASVLRVSGGSVAVVAELSPVDSPISGIAVGSAGEVFLATPAGIVRVVNGDAELVVDGRTAGLSTDLGALTLDGGGNLYLADNGTGRVIRRAPGGGLTLVAGTGHRAVAGSTPAASGLAASTDIGTVTGLVVDSGGNLLIADAVQQRVWAVAADGAITTLAGGATIGVDALPLGAHATDIAFGSVDGIAVDRQQRIYVADGHSHAVVRIGADGAVDVVVADPSATPSRGLAISPSGALVYSDGLVLWSVANVAGAG
jgi:actin-like ATPase involved in cell morphogenesis/sugar lactone lactonase YvrE